MAYEFKKLSEVAVAESVADETNVLIEEDGMIKKTARRNIGNVKSVNGVEPDEAGDVAFEYVKSVNGFEPDATGNVTMETSSVVVYYFNEPDGYVYKDASCTTKVTRAEVEAVISECKSNIVLKITTGRTEFMGYPLFVGNIQDNYITFVGYAFGDFIYVYTAEYEEEEPVGPPA